MALTSTLHHTPVRPALQAHGRAGLPSAVLVAQVLLLPRAVVNAHTAMWEHGPPRSGHPQILSVSRATQALGHSLWVRPMPPSVLQAAMYTHSLTSAQIVLDWILRLALLACLLAPLIQHAKSCAKMSPSVLHGFTTRQGYIVI